MRPLRVLSLFDGMSCGQVALRELGYPIEKYYASEVDKFAIQQTQLNFPDTVQLGDVRNIDVDKLCENGAIDMLIGGSPCQSFSFAGKRVGMKTTENEEIYTLERYLQLKQEGFEFEGQSYLFWEYMRILTELLRYNPNILFLLENVEMGKKWERVLSDAIGIRGVHINSALVSAQNRKRIYWSNIRVREEGLFGYKYTDIPQPADRGILLRDILEKEVDERYFLSDKMLSWLKGHSDKNNIKMTLLGEDDTVRDGNLLCITEATKKGYVEIRIGEAFDMTQPNSKTRRGRKMSSKCNCLTTQSADSYLVFEGMSGNSHLQNNLTDVDGKANSFLATSGKGAWSNGMTIIRVDGNKSSSQPNRIYSDRGKSPNIGSAHFSNTINVANGFRIRRIIPTECARLQTIPEWYKWECSETQQYRMLGNGWTVEVIKHIFSFMDIK